MRVLHITRDFPPLNNGGLSTAVGAMVTALVQAGISCSVVSFDNYRPRSGQDAGLKLTSQAGVTVLHVESATCLEQALGEALKLGADIVHVHHELLWDFGASVATKLSAGTIYTVHVLQSEQDRLRSLPTLSTLSARAQNTALNGCDVIACPSRAVATLLETDASLEVRVARLGIQASPEHAWAVTQERDYEAPTLLYVGRFADINGFQELLLALPAIFQEHPTLRAVIAGGLPGNSRGERRWCKRIEELAQSYPNRLEHVGWVSSERLSKLYASATILVVPSWFETFGQVAAEAQLHGVPLVCTNAGGLSELVSDDTATLIQSRQSPAIVDGVSQLLADRAATERKRLQGAEQAKKLLWDQRIEETVALYRDVIGTS